MKLEISEYLEHGTVPPELQCVISWELMLHPVRVVDAGRHFFEEDAIVAWLGASESPKHPLTNQPLLQPTLERSNSMHQALTEFRQAAAHAAEALGDADTAARLRDEVETLSQAHATPPRSIPKSTPERRAWLRATHAAETRGALAQQTAQQGRRYADSATRVALRAQTTVERVGTAIANVSVPRLAYALDVESLQEVAPESVVRLAVACVEQPSPQNVNLLVEQALQHGVDEAALFAAGEGTLMLALLATGDHLAIQAAHAWAPPEVYEDCLIALPMAGPENIYSSTITEWRTIPDPVVAARNFICDAQVLSISDRDADGQVLRSVAIDPLTGRRKISVLGDGQGLFGMVSRAHNCFIGRLNGSLQPHGFGIEISSAGTTGGVFRDGYFRHGVRRFNNGDVNRVVLKNYEDGPMLIGTQGRDGGLYAGTMLVDYDTRWGFGELTFTSHDERATIAGVWHQNLLAGPGLFKQGDAIVPGNFMRALARDGVSTSQGFEPFEEPADAELA